MHIAATREALISYFAKCGAVDRVIKLTDTVGIKQKAYKSTKRLCCPCCFHNYLSQLVKIIISYLCFSGMPMLLLPASTRQTKHWHWVGNLSFPRSYGLVAIISLWERQSISRGYLT